MSIPNTGAGASAPLGKILASERVYLLVFLRIYGAVAFIIADSSSDRYSESKKLLAIKATGSSSSIINSPDLKPRAFR